jgi:hypothetical protein
MRIKIGIVSILLLVASNLFGQYTLSPSTLNFFTVTKGSPDSILVTLTNTQSTANIEVTGIRFFHPETYSVNTGPFTLGPGQSRSFHVVCNPRHNIKYLDWMMLETNTEATVPACFVFAQGKFPNPYYDATQNKWDEDLESTLKSIITFNYLDLGYNGVRDEMFMRVDNKAFNGQGATQNTLECFYTGTLAVGYTSRTDCQNTFNFNTEHTMPQSFFNSAQPMMSDMFHLWPTDANANSERANKPFGVVSNPTWTVGGSKSSANLFEPRDVTKGRVARALFYFILRYQDYGNFVAPQESILRTWCATFLPDAVEKKRNDDIFALQRNRNPFIDHPEFLERITLLAGTGNRIPAPAAFVGDDTLNFKAPVPSGQTGYFILSNQGTDTLTFGNVSFSNPDFSLGQVWSYSIAPDSARKVYVNLNPASGGTNYNETVTFTTNDATRPSITIRLLGESFTVGLNEGNNLFPIVYPNPANHSLNLNWSLPIPENMTATLFDLSGKMVLSQRILAGSTDFGMNVADLSRGCYLLRIEGSARPTPFKVNLQ